MSAPLCARCGGALIVFACGPCRTINGAIRGVVGEDMPGAEWTGLVRLGPQGDVRLREHMRCAVVVGEEHQPHAWTQVPAGGRDEGQWVTQGSFGASSEIFRAWGEAMLARARRAEWLIDEQTKRRVA